MIWNREMETLDSRNMLALQEERLKKLVSRVYQNSSFYRSKMDQAGVTPADIQTLADITKLPFTTKQDMRESYPYGMLAVPLREVVRFHSSSGTTGKTTAVGYTKNDVNMWAEVLGRAMVSGGMNQDSIFQVAVNYGMFTGGLGMHYAAEFIGASVIPSSTGSTARQITLMQDFGTTAVILTPSYALYLAEAMLAQGINPHDLPVQTVLCGAEAWTENMRTEIENLWGVQSYDIYGLSEIIGPGVAGDCIHRGLHIQEDHFYPEVINPETGEVLPDGETGELVLTTLTKEGMPMLRYRTRDLTALERGQCQCGRTLVRMKKVLGRSDDMLIIRGVNLFPSQVESVLLGMGATAPHYQLVVEREKNLDVLTVMVEMTDALFSDQYANIEAMEAKIRHELKSVLGLTAKVRLVDPRTIERSQGKAKRVIDRRNL